MKSLNLRSTLSTPASASHASAAARQATPGARAARPGLRAAVLAFAAVGAIGYANAARAADAEATLVIENHRFQPAELKVPANTKVKVTIENRDASAEEFESHSLNREKVVPGKGKVVVYVGPLKPGRYPFYGEFNKSTAQGAVVAE